MKTYTYILTEKEVIALRDALIEYTGFIKDKAKETGKKPEDHAQYKTAEALKDQFKNDIK